MKDSHFLVAYVFAIFIITIILAFKPDYNWDMLPYMAVLKKMDGTKSPQQLHSEVYNTAKQNLPDKKYKILTDSTELFRYKMSHDAVAFEKQLPFFDIKPIYLLFAFVLYKLGLSLTYATVAPSLVAFFFINIVSFIWVKKFNLKPGANIFFLVLMCAVSMPLATRSNPDTLACFFLLTASYLFMETAKFSLAVIFLTLAILTRPENIIFSFFLFSIVLMNKWQKAIPFFISLVYLLIMLIAYYLPLKIMSYPGWSSLFYHAFIDNTADPSIKQTITIPVYLKVINENILNAKGIAALIALTILSAVILLHKNFKSESHQLYKLFYLVIIFWTVVKTLLFPMPGLRFVIPPILLMIFCVIKTFAVNLQNKI